MKQKKICLISSCGGHFMELMQLLPAVEGNNYYIITERNIASMEILQGKRYYLLLQQERNGLGGVFKFLWNIIISLLYFIKERPDIVITTGAGVSYPTCRIAKLFGKHLIYIESFAKLHTKSKTGELLYGIADKFYVQWPEMLTIYPNSEYHGTVY